MSTISEARAAIAAVMSERELSQFIIDLAGDLGWLSYRTHDSRHSPAGFPDLVLLRERIVFAELKREDDGTRRTNLSAMQASWRDALRTAGMQWFLWRPSHLLDGTIHSELT